MSALHLANELVQLAPLTAPGNDDFLGWGNDKVSGVRGLLRNLSYAMGMGFVIWRGFAARGALAAIVVSGIAAAVFIYLVHNITDVEERVGNEIDPPTATSLTQIHGGPIEPTPTGVVAGIVPPSS